MRLLKQGSSGSFELMSFPSNNLPPYAILSHTWNEGQEVTYDDMIAGTGREKSGYDKIRFCAKRAAIDRLEYFWVDSCCINKDSSAELSESINSMYRWYENAQICYAYIEDWPADHRWADLASIFPDEENKWQSEEAQRLSNEEVMFNREITLERTPLRWFTRGWTLQELIAPERMEFFDGRQMRRGSKAEEFVIAHLSRITGIAQFVLCDEGGRNLRKVCHGQRMSWAAYRETSREEDIAYCLLGIFDINMPLLYGEGKKAFLRLQEEILKYSTDMSLLAWTQQPTDLNVHRGILSNHPSEFRDLRFSTVVTPQFRDKDEILMTNKGFRMETHLVSYTDQQFLHSSRLDVGILPLEHFSGWYCQNAWQGILIRRLGHSYVRAKPHVTFPIDPTMKRHGMERLYLARDVDFNSDQDYRRRITTSTKVKVSWKKTSTAQLMLVESWPKGDFDVIIDTFMLERRQRFVGYLLLRYTEHNSMLTGQKHDNVVEFMVLITRNEKMRTRVSILNMVQARDFKDFIVSYREEDWYDFLQGTEHEMERENWAPKLLHRASDHGSQLTVEINGHIVDRHETSTDIWGFKEGPPQCVEVSITVDRQDL